LKDYKKQPFFKKRKGYRISAILDVKGAAMDASASERLIPT
jgi:hypothetical protein